MIKVTPKFGIIKSYKPQVPTLIVLHDTAGPSVRSAEQTFMNERPALGYHYMIEKNGDVFQYAYTGRVVYHAAGFNYGTISISYAGGGGYGAVNEAQIKASIELINDVIRPVCGHIDSITGHKHCSPGRKIDPEWPGEPKGKTDLAVDKVVMDRIARETGLEFLTHKDLENR